MRGSVVPRPCWPNGKRTGPVVHGKGCPSGTTHRRLLLSGHRVWTQVTGRGELCVDLPHGGQTTGRRGLGGEAPP